MTTRTWNTNLNYLRGISGAAIAELLVEAARQGLTVTLNVDDERRAMAYSLIKREAEEGREMSFPEAYRAVGAVLAALEDKGPDAFVNRVKARLNTKGSAAGMPKGSWSCRTMPNSKGKKSKTLELTLTVDGMAQYGINPQPGQVIGFTRTNRNSFGQPIMFS